MKQNIRKTIRFSAEDYNKVEVQLIEYDITFTTFARKALLREKIKYPIKIEQLYVLQTINNNLEIIAKEVFKITSSNKQLLLLLQLSEIEKVMKKLL